MAWQKTAVLIGALAAIVSQWWGGPGSATNLYLPLIGGVLVLIGTLVKGA